ncbi:hypothetical protein B0H67DRAFT_652299 [Lasiosphaeris hirsuta]|uniref:Uncharacterized protein n=1 Tax=Lasiosphaeris hirsuta TaxID=260670 RepID=A0AA40B9U5_9PEZI|nr:hypothetical protein B0H67DRAFT_652299 [Lasiosphaeris hirsuta]
MTSTTTHPPPVRPDENLPILLLPEDAAERGRAALGRGLDLEVDTRKKPDESPAPAPEHPITAMQDAFAESLIEATHGGKTPKPKLRTGDAKARREELLDQAKTDGPPVELWRHRPGQVNHELRRLMAQISFGVYLLLNGMANSQILVVSILQGHIDEVDEFLETTLEDIGLATKDLRDRVDHLKLPMDNMEVFERMLEDRNFRVQILDGNQKIEHIVARTQVALHQIIEDLAEGVSSTREFSIYLAEQQHGQWRRDRPDVIDIFDAMKGNTDGWFNAFIDLQAKASTLNGLIAKLNGMVSEMERKAGEVSRSTRLSVEPYSSPQHSPQASNASSVTTPPASPILKISNAPPRLSLRLSSINQMDSPEISFFDIQTRRESVMSLRPRQPQQPAQETPPPEIGGEEEHEENDHEYEKEDEEIAPPARNPRRLSERPPPPEDPTVENEDADAGLYILQPRTYTPLPPSPLPSPLPSPFIVDRRQPRMEDRPRTRGESLKPRVDSLSIAVEVPTPHRVSTPHRVESLQPRMVEHTQPQPSKPKLVAIGARPEPRQSRKQDTNPEVTVTPEPRSELEAQPQQRTSLRQRVSLKTTPPESIQVPPPNVELQRPIYHSPRTYQAPDSAYGSDMERPPIPLIVSMDPPIPDFPAPARPRLIPSPHSDQQFFRPVQASPHSPLQQRPHTSGTMSTSRFPNQQAPPRNIPSAMGMSMLSNVTTMTHETGSSQTLKKKRSAFGWLKKAFSLDDEERAAFEQKKREQGRNLYYDQRSPKFLDGKRVQSRQAF